MIRVIYLDIDGTLRDETEGVTPQTARALEQCRAQGIYIVLSTGRNPASIQPDVRRLSTDGLIAGGGCYVRVQGRTLRRAHFLRPTVQAALALAARSGAALSLEAEGCIFMNKSAAQFYARDFERKLLGCPQPELARRDHCIRYEDNLSSLDLRRTPVHKICLIGPRQAILQASGQLAGLARTVQQGRWDGSWYLELLPPGCGKGSALRMVNRYLGIPRSGSLCFGDGANDLDMFRAAGTRVAVRGSCPALVQLADSLCGPPSESGIAQELVRRHILPAPPQTQKGA